MRKPRDFDAELKTLNDRARQLKEQRLRQFGELVIATNADALPLEELAGALLGVAETEEPSTREGWRRRGAAFLQVARKAGGGPRDTARREQADHGGAPSASPAPIRKPESASARSTDPRVPLHAAMPPRQ